MNLLMFSLPHLWGKLSRKHTSFYISIWRRVNCMIHRGKFNLDGFVPTVDTAVENEFRMIRSRITRKRRWKFPLRVAEYTWYGLTRQEFSFTCSLIKRIKSLLGVNARRCETSIETRKPICNPSPFDQWHVPILMQINPHARRRCGLRSTTRSWRVMLKKTYTALH